MPDQRSQTKEKVKGISLRLLVVLGISAVFLVVLFFLTDEIVLENEGGFDAAVFHFVDSLRSTGLTSFLTFFTFFGSTKFLMPAYILLSLYFILFRRNNKRSFNIAAIGISSGLLLHLVKDIFQRHRPPHPLIANVNGFSFPSGHSFSTFTFVGLLIYMLWETKTHVVLKSIGTALLFVFAAIVAGSRVYLHVHYGSDVLAGFCLAFLWLVICIFFLEKMNYTGSFKWNR
jgi:undecaprenyl-diphosphatase